MGVATCDAWRGQAGLRGGRAVHLDRTALGVAWLTNTLVTMPCPWHQQGCAPPLGM